MARETGQSRRSLSEAINNSACASVFLQQQLATGGRNIHNPFDLCAPRFLFHTPIILYLISKLIFFLFALRTTAALWARCLLMAIITPAAEEEEGNLCVLLFLRIEARERERKRRSVGVRARVTDCQRLLGSTHCYIKRRRPSVAATGKQKRHQQQPTESPHPPNGNHTANRNNIYIYIILYILASLLLLLLRLSSLRVRNYICRPSRAKSSLSMMYSLYL